MEPRTSRNTPPPLITRRTWLWALVVFVLTFAGTSGALFWLVPMDDGAEGTFGSVVSVAKAVADVAVSPDLAFGHRDYLTLVIIGKDVDRDRRGQVMKTYGRSDTIIVAYLDRNAHTVSLLSVPRDMLMRIKGSVMRVNAAHSFGGPELLIETLANNLCLNVHHWLRVNFEGSVKIIDAVGGVWVDVEKDMKYDDNWGNLHINLKQGYQKLDGDKAHQYLRFRKDREGDIGRIRRQQQLMRALAKTLLQPNKLLKLPKIAKSINEVIETDLTDSEVMSLAAFMRKANANGVSTEILPGYARNGHWVMATSEAEDVLRTTMGRAFELGRWRQAGKGRYRNMPIPQAPVSDPPPTTVPEPATTEAADGQERGEPPMVEAAADRPDVGERTEETSEHDSALPLPPVPVEPGGPADGAEPVAAPAGVTPGQARTSTEAAGSREELPQTVPPRAESDTDGGIVTPHRPAPVPVGPGAKPQSPTGKSAPKTAAPTPAGPGSTPVIAPEQPPVGRVNDVPGE